MREDSALGEVLSSKGRIRIIEVLAEVGELNISEIARRSGLNYKTTSRHLQALKEAGLVQEKNFGRIRIFRFKSENVKALAIKRLVEVWKEPYGHEKPPQVGKAEW